jgi:hypothetical protein
VSSLPALLGKVLLILMLGGDPVFVEVPDLGTCDAVGAQYTPHEEQRFACLASSAIA